MRAITLGLLAAVACSSFVTACGSDDDHEHDDGAPHDQDKPASCESFTPCGGDPTGSWTLTKACVENGGDLLATLLPPACSDAYRDTTVSGTGTYTFSNGTASSTQMLVSTSKLAFSDACVMAIGVSGSAASQCGALQTTFASDKKTYSSASCKVDGALCVCDVGIDANGEESGSYRVEGTNILVMDKPQAFCVRGNTLTIKGSVDGIEATLALTKK